MRRLSIGVPLLLAGGTFSACNLLAGIGEPVLASDAGGGGTEAGAGQEATVPDGAPGDASDATTSDSGFDGADVVSGYDSRAGDSGADGASDGASEGGGLSCCDGGACVVCSVPPHGVGTCNGGGCAFTCPPPYELCAGNTCCPGTTSYYGYPSLTAAGGPEPYKSGYLFGEKISIPVAIQVTALGVNAVSGGPSVIIALYRDSSGPTDLVTSTASTPLVAGGNPVSVTPTTVGGGSYWIMAEYSADATIGSDNSTSNPTIATTLTYGSALPNPFTSVTTYTGPDIGLFVVGTP